MELGYNFFNRKELKSGVFPSVNDAVLSALGAYNQYNKLTLNERQEIIDAVKKKLLDKVEEIAYMTVKETDMGNVGDKIQKLTLAINKTPGVEDLITEVKTGDNGMTLYELSSYGVICAIHPCTNPCATLISNTIGMLAAGNSVVHCPHPRAVNVSKYVTEIISVAIRETCGIDNLVVTLNEISITCTDEIMSHPDIAMIVTTGGNNVLRQAMSSGKKVIGAGPANPTTIVDETADIKKAARDIVKGASFDNNIMCISEKSIVVVDCIADSLVEELIRNDVYYVNNDEEMLKLTRATLTNDITLNKILEGKSANEILAKADIKCERYIRLIVVNTIKQHPFATVEMLMPLIPLIRVKNFEVALETAIEIEQGFRHTATIHSQSIDRLNIAAKEMQTSVFVKNGSSLVGIGVNGEGDTSFTIATATGEGTTTARHFARRRRCSLTSGFSIR
ncbi:aldehyde dehydrogenase family protein [Clostridium intestinale]|uniref:Propionaldehyde dehydrogenase n=1 Tax=Clostridium intestinale DSM 6191 TaxID=1121320 RepID=A0A1M5XS00_9CLOT|nr:aldehyde dehydrogenase family protein [Clostridium intestinale]SHI02452.1 propionaldehyde dehydrogenase [Clostridium intestinale DSM 6191]